MRIAVTAKDTTLEADVDPRFGRAAYILLVDTENMKFEVIDNAENANALKGAGIQAAGMISRAGADVLLTGFCGPNAFKTLSAADIDVVSDVAGTVKEALQLYQKGGFSKSKGPNAEARW
jgi:predicted Fe-Mo cluster-binding NifX family protein